MILGMVSEMKLHDLIGGGDEVEGRMQGGITDFNTEC